MSKRKGRRPRSKKGKDIPKGGGEGGDDGKLKCAVLKIKSKELYV